MDTHINLGLRDSNTHIYLPYSTKLNVDISLYPGGVDMSLGVSNFPLFINAGLDELGITVDDGITINKKSQLLVVDADPMNIKSDMDNKSFAVLDIKENKDYYTI